MNSAETIRAKVGLRCSIRLSGSELQIARGITEELTRETIVVVTSPAAGSRWLEQNAEIFIAVELPFGGTFEPRLLECAASVSRVRTAARKVRIVAKVHRMSVMNGSRLPSRKGCAAQYSCAADAVSAVARPHDDNPANSFGIAQPVFNRN